jgi:hypothetical protein
MQTMTQAYEDLITGFSELDDVVLTEAISEHKPAIEAFSAWLVAQNNGDVQRILETGATVVGFVKQYVGQAAVKKGIAV